MKALCYICIAVFAIITAALGYNALQHPISMSSLGFIAWTLSPYAYLIVLTKLAVTKAANSAVLLIALIAGSAGTYLIVDSMFIHPDAQGGLVFLFAPALQWALLILVSIPLYFLNGAKKP